MAKGKRIVRGWTARDLEILRTMREDGATKQAIARKLGRTWWSIRAKFPRTAKPASALQVRASQEDDGSYSVGTNNDLHLHLVFAASSEGFPVMVSTPKQRIAA